jgi:G:T-mismatch repair DNA endonuclease (very short patch repair protein)
MPKSNVSFWEQKFSENVERDRRVARALSEQGWHVLVVWECELLKRTIETIEKVSRALREQLGTAAQFKYDESITGREKLLAVAEEKVRYRISKYDHDKD